MLVSWSLYLERVLTFRRPSQSVVRRERPLNRRIFVDPPRAGSLGCSSSGDRRRLGGADIFINIIQKTLRPALGVDLLLPVSRIRLGRLRIYMMRRLTRKRHGDCNGTAHASTFMIRPSTFMIRRGEDSKRDKDALERVQCGR